MDWNRVQGSWKQLEGKLQQLYGPQKDQVRKEVDAWFPRKATSPLNTAASGRPPGASFCPVALTL